MDEELDQTSQDFVDSMELSLRKYMERMKKLMADDDTRTPLYLAIQKTTTH